MRDMVDSSRSSTICRVSAVAAALAAVGAAAPARAQLNASEPASVSQTVDGTRLEVRYSRPRLRGRRGVFGTSVAWGYVWTAGANAATTLAVSKPVTIEGTPIAAGRYSVWLIPARTGPWEFVLDRDTTLFHTQGPKPRAGQVRVPVVPARGPLTEVLTWSFPDVSTGGATLAMQWDTISVPLRVRVAPTFATAVAADAAAPVVGRYDVRFEFSGPPGSKRSPAKDSAANDPAATASATKASAAKESAAAEDAPSREVTFAVRYEGGELRGRMTPALFRHRDGFADWILVPRRPGYYALGRVQGGELAEVMDGILLSFTTANGRATGLEIRGNDDSRFAAGTRLP